MVFAGASHVPARRQRQEHDIQESSTKDVPGVPPHPSDDGPGEGAWSRLSTLGEATHHWNIRGDAGYVRHCSKRFNTHALKTMLKNSWYSNSDGVSMPAASYEKLKNSLLEDYFRRALSQFGQHFLEKLPTTLQSMMNAKLSQQRFWHCYDNRLIKTVQTIPHNTTYM